MNPSAGGWIEKLIRLNGSQDFLRNADDVKEYEQLLVSGFIYGTNVTPWLPVESDNKLTEKEICKINLFLALWSVALQRQPDDQEEAINSILDFYVHVKANRFNFLDKLLVGKKTTARLEKILHSRILIDQNIIAQNFSHIITNALLFIDVLSFEHYLSGEEDAVLYAERLETLINQVVYETLNSKRELGEYDILLLELVEASLRYHQAGKTNTISVYLELLPQFPSYWERAYIFDLACMCVWDDHVLNEEENKFLLRLGKRLDLKRPLVEKKIEQAHTFMVQHKDKISLFNHSNPVKHFYDQSVRTVSILVMRNKKRLIKEVMESKELLLLLTKSTVKNLSQEEKQKVKVQLLDICKSIPSLAVFALPGGTILLPLLVKFIPKLLPSSFDDNRVK